MVIACCGGKSEGVFEVVSGGKGEAVSACAERTNMMKGSEEKSYKELKSWQKE